MDFRKIFGVYNEKSNSASHSLKDHHFTMNINYNHTVSYIFSGPIPKEIHYLDQLEILSLSHTTLVDLFRSKSSTCHH
jgi:hypothetical protein